MLTDEMRKSRPAILRNSVTRVDFGWFPRDFRTISVGTPPLRASGLPTIASYKTRFFNFVYQQPSLSSQKMGKPQLAWVCDPHHLRSWLMLPGSLDWATWVLAPQFPS
jgi:hypothetical protein